MICILKPLIIVKNKKPLDISEGFIDYILNEKVIPETPIAMRRRPASLPIKIADRVGLNRRNKPRRMAITADDRKRLAS